ncbi:hypothetical protein PAXINDRAFT_163398 [Paxillus involutus ATCC 200175]|uniref:Uncharacterized protein n=1 Tax=Paxillus involutus ATCC 200175 TaxID=664439 RepID=A0A0C9U4U4_PAXIN|nr:hypothetical protein PAXINDRAFT_163398 [Paxillus involutus ATCC 200175]
MALDELACNLLCPLPDVDFVKTTTHYIITELNGVQVPMGTYPALQCNSSVPKDFKHVILKPVVIVVNINKRPARALVDTGSLSDFMSSTLAEQLHLPCIELSKPLSVQLAIQGSRSKVHFSTKVLFEYQWIKTEQYFNIINLQNNDLILGTPFLFQHQVMVGFNESKVVVGSDLALPIRGTQVQLLESRAADILKDHLDAARKHLQALAKPLCVKASKMGLPSLRAINHTIPLIDPSKIYPWRLSRCPEALRPQWTDKRKAYLVSGY